MNQIKTIVDLLIDNQVDFEIEWFFDSTYVISCSHLMSIEFEDNMFYSKLFIDNSTIEYSVDEFDKLLERINNIIKVVN